MNIQLLSDLHLEFHPDEGAQFVEGLDASGVDVLVLAGDISLTSGNRLRRALNWFCAKYPHVVFVAGNHELYGSTVAEGLSEMDSISESLPNLHWLENETVTIDGHRFVGSTLWFREQADGLNNHYGKGINDFYRIKGFRAWVYRHNKISAEFLEKTVASGDIVVTHHIPTIEGVHPRWRPSQGTFGRFFTCQMPYDVLHKPDMWFFGHTHDPLSFELQGTRFRCNPLGYVEHETNPKFEPRLILETR